MLCMAAGSADLHGLSSPCPGHTSCVLIAVGCWGRHRRVGSDPGWREGSEKARMSRQQQMLQLLRHAVSTIHARAVQASVKHTHLPDAATAANLDLLSHIRGVRASQQIQGVAQAQVINQKPARCWHKHPRPTPPAPWHPEWLQCCRHAPAATLQQVLATARNICTHGSSKQSPAVDPSKGFVRGGYTVDMFPPERIRNFSIIAHVDHGKSTLADRLMEHTGALAAGKAHPAQYLDKLQVERDRGITVKAQTVSLVYRHSDGLDYLINLIDTPGHVDFSYEVSRSLAACQGALLLVDAGQGVQAQTVANWRLALEQGLVVVPALNKIDLPQADIPAVTSQLESVCAVAHDEVLLVSAKTGQGLDSILPAIVSRVPPPQGSTKSPLRLLLFDAFHDEFRGVITLVEVVDGSVSKGDKVSSVASGETWEVLEVGVLAPERHPCDRLLTGQVGYIITGIKDLKAARVGDTWVHPHAPAPALPGFRPARSMMYAGLYPINPSDFDTLAVAMDRLTLNDASVVVKRENSDALGPGFRCGFLGMLHMEVFMQRLEQEHQIAVVTTTPTVPYLVDLGPEQEPLEISRATDLPTDQRIYEILEPTVIATIITPVDYTGKVMELCGERRGELLEHTMLTSLTSARAAHDTAGSAQGTAGSAPDSTGSGSAGSVTDSQGQGRCLLRYVLPLSELAGNLYSQIKARTQGYASFDYEPGDYRPADLQRLDILAHGKPVDALARLVHRDEIVTVGRSLIQKMKELLDRQQFEVILQAAANGRIIARETIKAMRKDVTAKCYGGDVTRKRKLLEKQKDGKARMKRLGSIDVPASAFPELMKTR